MNSNASLAGLPRAERARILIVDDEPLVGELLQDLLKIFGYEPEYCCIASEALQRLEQEEFDLILLDCRMPQINGGQFYYEVAGRDPRMARRIVFLTGDTHSDETQFLLRSTGSMHVGKPFQLEKIKVLLEQALASAVSAPDCAPAFRPGVSSCPQKKESAPAWSAVR